MRTPAAIALSLTLLCAAAPTAAADDYTATSRCSMSVKPHYSMTTLLRQGIRVPVRCDGPANVMVALQIDRPQALDFRMPGNGIQDLWGDAQIARASTTKVKVTMDKRSRKRLNRSDRTFSGKMFLCIGPYGTRKCRAFPKDRRRVTFTR